MTFVAVAERQGDDPSDLWGEVRAVCSPDKDRAEFSIQVAPSHRQCGLGALLLRKLMDYLRQQGVRELVGLCLTENQPMLALAHQLGFGIRVLPDEAMAELTRALASPEPQC